MVNFMPKKIEKITVGNYLIFLKKKLSDVSIENPDINAEMILGKAANLDRTEIYLNMEMGLEINEVRKAEKFLKRRLDGEPLQYIMGETEFYSLPFVVDGSVLIPRPETEILVEWALEIIKPVKIPKILDIGAGSGAISVAIAANHPDADINAFDKSMAALKIAAANSRLNDVRDRIQFVVGDLFKEDFTTCVGKNYDLIVCNPPYISVEEMRELSPEVRDFEPRAALTDEKDGLVFARRLAEVLPRLTRKNSGWALVEIDSTRAEKTLQILKSAIPNAVIKNDLAGKPRIIGGKVR